MEKKKRLEELQFIADTLAKLLARVEELIAETDNQATTQDGEDEDGDGIDRPKDPPKNP